jgi:mRNA interferase YafQ
MTKTVVLDVSHTSQFKRDYKKAAKQGKDLVLLKSIVDALRNCSTISAKFRDHALSNNWINHRELHLTTDWLLIYMIDKKNNTLVLVRLGSQARISFRTILKSSTICIIHWNVYHIAFL